MSILFSFLFFCSCSVLTPADYYKGCQLVPSERIVENVKLKEDLKAVSTIVRVSKLTKTAKTDLKCLLTTEFDRIEKQEGLHLFTIIVEDTGAVFHYGFNFELDSLLEVQFVPVDKDVFFMSSVIVPLKNVIKAIKNPANAPFVFVADQQMGLMSAGDFTLFMQDITNGKFVRTTQETKNTK